MRPIAILILALVLACRPSPGTAHSPADASSVTPPASEAPRLETLLKAQLESLAGTEVILSRVVLPPHVTLPRHWHPGEEFAHVLAGSVVLWQEGKEDLRLTAGQSAMVP